MSGAGTDPELVARLCGLVGVEPLPEDVELLALVLDNELGQAEQLRVLELDDLEPIVSFDPRWR